eukprot:Ihof_evm8s130 gene=Ihof_evmTU8s130
MISNPSNAPDRIEPVGSLRGEHGNYAAFMDELDDVLIEVRYAVQLVEKASVASKKDRATLINLRILEGNEFTVEVSMNGFK